MSGEEGQVTLFGIGMVLMMLVVGGVSFDLWHVIVERRALYEIADAAAAAGANGIDENYARDIGEYRLDADRALAFANANLAQQTPPQSLDGPAQIAVTPFEVTVTINGRVDFVLLSIISPDDGIDLQVHAQAQPLSGRGRG